MTSRIRWTEAERDAVLAQAVVEFHKNASSGLEALRVAQRKVLPISRQRSLQSHSAAHEDVKRLAALYRARLSSLLNTPPKETPTAAEPAPPVHIDAPSVHIDAPPVHIDAPVEPTLDAMVASIAKRVALMLVQSIKHEIKELEHSFSLPKHDPTYANAHKQQPHVVIVGLLQDQAHLIEREYGKDYAFKFIRAEDAKHASIPTASAYLLMKSFISHAVFDKYQKLPQHVLIDGGMSTLRSWLSTKGKELHHE